MNLIQYSTTSTGVKFSYKGNTSGATLIWYFGDDSTSEDKEPIHQYTSSGVFNVTLEVTIDGSTSTHNIDVPINLNKLSIDQYIGADLPEGLSINEESKAIWVKKWQEFISVLVSPPIKPKDIYNYMAYPPLVNALIAKLTVYDAYLRASEGALVLLMQTSSGSEESTSTSGPGGQEKAIETGPARVEWHDASNAIGALLRKGTGEDGGSIFDILRRQICMLASRVGIRLWICPKDKAPTIIPKMTHVAPSIIRRSHHIIGRKKKWRQNP